jgi:UPF0755 protein
MKARLAVPAAAAVLALLGWGVRQRLVSMPHQGFREPVLVEIPRGAGSFQVAGRLAAAGVVRSRWEYLLVRALRLRDRPQAGEYRFAEPAAPWQVYSRLARGDIHFLELRVPEGSNRFEIARLVEDAGIAGAPEFLDASSSNELVRDLAPGAPSLEGFLFPSTYRFRGGAGAAEVCRVLTGQFRKVWRELGSPAGAEPAVTLASLIEREAVLAAERPRIAAVFQNRLRIGMKLDCDPTVVYAALLVGAWRGSIYRSDLDRKHPYNTYLHAGLPPGPIANPGLESLHAALTPAATNELYFVARPDGSGAHEFSSDLPGHERAVSRYRNGQAKPQRAAAAARGAQKRRAAAR